MLSIGLVIKIKPNIKLRIPNASVHPQPFKFLRFIIEKIISKAPFAIKLAMKMIVNTPSVERGAAADQTPTNKVKIPTRRDTHQNFTRSFTSFNKELFIT